MMKDAARAIVLSILLCLLIGGAPVSGEPPPAGKPIPTSEELLLPQVLPPPQALPGGLELDQPIALYPGNEMLFKLIDGAGETHIRFGFKVVLQAIYRWKDSEHKVILQVYEMDSDYNAYGLYTVQNYPGTVDLKIGHEGNLQVSVVLFWKDRFFARLESTSDDADIIKKVVEFARAVARRIPKTGSKPPLVALLPLKNQLPKTIKFFHHQKIFQNIDYLPYLGKENVLRLGAGVDMVTARYKSGAQREVTLFVIQYPSAEEASRALRDCGKFVQSKKAPQEVKRGQVKQEGNVLAGIWGEATPQAVELLEQILLNVRREKRRISVRKDKADG